MRSFLAGLLLLSISTAAFGQVKGEVESLGFGGYYRPDCWTPMVVRLESQVAETVEYRIEVHQRDLDQDRVIYTKSGITLNPQGSGAQRWEMYFLPQPTGLPDGIGNTVQQLQKELEVFLCTKDGKQLMQLPLTQQLQNIDPRTGGFEHHRGRKLVLYVADSTSRPAWNEYQGQQILGLIDDVLPQRINARDLPESVLAYQSVDALVWVSGNVSTLSEGGSHRLSALQDYVRQGGSLVVCHPAQWSNISDFAEMLPIELKDATGPLVSIEEKKDVPPRNPSEAPHHLEPITLLARFKTTADSGVAANRWLKVPGPLKLARAKPKPNVLVEEWIDWKNDQTDVTPYIARGPYGYGAVTWVAQDMGDAAYTGPNSSGWPYVWDRVFGWKNDTHIAGDIDNRTKDSYGQNATDSDIDLGAALLKGPEFSSKGAGLIVLAMFFFVAYWIVAGPASYLFLVGRKRAEKSWFIYCAAALAATALTVLVVRLVLHGSPEVHHVSFVRMGPGQPAIVSSNIGLYIPRDGEQHIELLDTSKAAISYISPLPLHPQYRSDEEFPANVDYHVPVHDAATPDPVAVDVPYRSTLKKLQAQWVGDIPKGVRAVEVMLNPKSTGTTNKLSGTLYNQTGQNLRNVYLAFNDPGEHGGVDLVFYLPSWPASGLGSRIDLATAFAGAKILRSEDLSAENPDNQQGPKGVPVIGMMHLQWGPYWYKTLSTATRDDFDRPAPKSFPIMSLFDRIPPARNEGDMKAMELLRRGGRGLNMSQWLAAGQLVILAQDDDRPLPFPFQVAGNLVEGTGRVFYQFAIPLDHGGITGAPTPEHASK